MIEMKCERDTHFFVFSISAPQFVIVVPSCFVHAELRCDSGLYWQHFMSNKFLEMLYGSSSSVVSFCDLHVSISSSLIQIQYWKSSFTSFLTRSIVHHESCHWWIELRFKSIFYSQIWHLTSNFHSLMKKLSIHIPRRWLFCWVFLCPGAESAEKSRVKSNQFTNRRRKEKR